MAASSARIRLGLYGVVLVALVAAAIIALFSIGNDGTSNAADPGNAPGLSTGPVASTSSVSPSPSLSFESAPATTGPATTAPATTPATSSSSSAPATKSSSPAANMKSESTSKTRPVSGSQKASKAKVYVVKRGDNLTAIAAWFHVRGFEPLYAWNKTVIGQNPDLIFPGQKIVVDPGGAVSVSKG